MKTPDQLGLTAICALSAHHFHLGAAPRAAPFSRTVRARVSASSASSDSGDTGPSAAATDYLRSAGPPAAPIHGPVRSPVRFVVRSGPVRWRRGDGEMSERPLTEVASAAPAASCCFPTAAGPAAFRPARIGQVTYTGCPRTVQRRRRKRDPTATPGSETETNTGVGRRGATT